MLGWFLNALRTERIESESISVRKQQILFRDVKFGNNIREKTIEDIT